MVKSTIDTSVQYAHIKQQLIDARDSLDTQVTRLKRLHTFYFNTIRLDSEVDFVNAVAEAIVDIFELELGICWSVNPRGEPKGYVGCLGLNLQQQELSDIGRYLFQNSVLLQQNRTLTGEIISGLSPCLDLANGMNILCRDVNGQPIAMLLGGNTVERVDFFSQITTELEESFELFATQVAALSENLQGRATIERLNENLSAILHALPDLLFELDIEGLYINVWAQDKALLAKNEEHLLGRTVSEVLPADAAESVLDSLREADQEGTSFGRRIRLDLDVGVRWFELSVAKKETDSADSLFIVISRDVTERKFTEDRLRDSEARFRTIFESTEEISVQGYDSQRRIVYWNKASENLYGYTLDAVLGKRIEDLIIPEESRDVAVKALNSWIEGGSAPPPSEQTLVNARGARLQVYSSRVKLAGPDGTSEIYNIDVNLTKLRMAQEQIKLLSMAVEQSPVSVIITDPDGNIEYVNSSFESITGYRSAEVLGRNPRLFRSGKTPRAVYEEMWDTISSGRSWHGQLLNRIKSGKLIWENLHIAPVLSETGKINHYLAVKEDVTLKKEQEEKILNQAHFDSLTQLPNRLLCLDRLSQYLVKAERNSEAVAVLFLDLDDFKKVNDIMGHDIGDRLLVMAADRLRGVVRKADTVGRLGGDEFLVLMEGLQAADDAGVIADKLLTSFREPFYIDDREIVLTLSIGAAIYPQDGISARELLRNSDLAMYHSKAQGRNTCSYFTLTMNLDANRRFQIEEQMSGALERGEFNLLFQPLFTVVSQSICGIEALLRWNNPALGEIPPAEFIRMAEQNGMIVPIGRYVLKQAIEQYLPLRDLKDDLYVSVNLSPRQFRDPDLLRDIEALFDSKDFSPENLVLEITEGVLMRGHDFVNKAMLRLSELKIKIAMDDFGTGYSSLNYLRVYPFSVIKIDRSFISDMAISPAAFELVSAAIAMAHRLGLKVIAEGVESEEQLVKLKALSCDIAQGSLFSQPVPADMIPRLMK